MDSYRISRAANSAPARRRNVLAASALIILISFSASPPAGAGWVQNGISLNGIWRNGYSPFQPELVSGGSGNTFAIWMSADVCPLCMGENAYLDLQRVDTMSALLWMGPHALFYLSLLEENPFQLRLPLPTHSAASDGCGGVIAVWMRDFLCAQRVDPAGASLWDSCGVCPCYVGLPGSKPAVASDGGGGAIIVWVDTRHATSTNDNWDIYAQRIGAAGDMPWGNEEIPVCTAPEPQQRPSIVADGSGGVFIAWEDSRSGTADIYAQHLDSNGSASWTEGGIPLCNASGGQKAPQAIPDGSGGAIIAWHDYRDLLIEYDVFAQRVTATGTVLWQANGTPACTETGDQISLKLIPDGTGGAIITWMDQRMGDWDIYAQRLSASGAKLWANQGKPVCVTYHDQGYPAIAPDGAGGAVVAWEDKRNDSDLNIYAQRMDPDGNILWSWNGIPVCMSDGDQGDPAIAPDGTGGAIVAWKDYCTSLIYAQRVLGDGGVLDIMLQSHEATCADGAVTITWTLSNPDERLEFFVLRGTTAGEAFEELGPEGISAEGASYIYRDATVIAGETYRYRVDIVEGGARRTLFETAPVAVPALPLTLFQNAPNPFNPSTTVKYYLPAPCEVTLAVYDASGRLVATLVDRRREPMGYHSRIWSGCDSHGRPVRSGVYFSVLAAGKERLSGKMVLLR